MDAVGGAAEYTELALPIYRKKTHCTIAGTLKTSILPRVVRAVDDLEVDREGPEARGHGVLLEDDADAGAAEGAAGRRGSEGGDRVLRVAAKDDEAVRARPDLNIPSTPA